MKIILAFLLLCSVPTGIFSQINRDSLLREWKNESVSASYRLKALDLLLSDVVYLSNNTDSALVFAGKMYDLAVEKKLGVFEGNALIHKGWSYNWQYKTAQALTEFEKALSLFTTLRNDLGLTNATLGLGSVYIEKGDFARSQEYLSQSLDFAEKTANKKKISQVLHFIGTSYFQSGNEQAAKTNWEQGYKIAQEADYQYEIAMSLFNLGNIFGIQGNFRQALDYYLQADALLQSLGDTQIVPTIISNIGGIYRFIENYPKAIEYLQRSIALSKEQHDMVTVAWSTAIIADIYIELEEYDKAKQYANECYSISQESDDAHGTLMALRAFAEISAHNKEFNKAIEYANKGLKIADETNDLLVKSFIYELLGKDVYTPLKQFSKALLYCNKALDLYENSGSLLGKRNTCECIYKAYKGMGQANNALAYYERFQQINDSLKIEETARKFQEMEYEKVALRDSLQLVEEKRLVQASYEKTIRQKEQTRNISYLVGGLVLIVAGGLFSRLRYIRRSKARLQEEKDRSETLLLNILPEEVANELKEKGRSMARDFDLVSILFSDFVGFTEASAKLSAQDLVTEINTCFETFDGIMATYGIEKIKTIGDAYMAAGGLPIQSEDSVKRTILAALDMQAFISKRKVEMESLGKHAFQMRVGIHTGPVVAGIVGVKKFQYDIWGDTVNTANRIENKGKIGKVNISKATYELVKNDPSFSFVSRGKIVAKGKGEIEMHFVERANIS